MYLVHHSFIYIYIDIFFLELVAIYIRVHYESKISELAHSAH